MIKRVKKLGSDSTTALISDDSIRAYLANFESELSRGISTICVLKIIKNSGDQGITGYQILKELEEQSKSMLILEEGRLYPFLKKLENWKSSTGVVNLISARKEQTGRKKKFYFITPEGVQILNHLDGFFSKLLEYISPMLSFQVELQEDHYLYCPNCANKIDLNEDIIFCAMCGLDIENIKNQRLEGLEGGNIND
ncbi:hypothetical protein NEF87_003255 [Candidatus Lokiarchaeum ossiferum]|uniref:Transcription regulator PadR N-terminal domain-containing protein n=1 Tax=Candidatus Lokiarchaeum ossiferum TaxID=2951803 RepID=A0ABY6HU63_9ARCH|nr:hypothetical protein NEF87_003255 [Candidatus Lokiarchaeum sp. B-35]